MDPKRVLNQAKKDLFDAQKALFREERVYLEPNGPFDATRPFRRQKGPFRAKKEPFRVERALLEPERAQCKLSDMMYLFHNR